MNATEDISQKDISQYLDMVEELPNKGHMTEFVIRKKILIELENELGRAKKLGYSVFKIYPRVGSPDNENPLLNPDEKVRLIFSYDKLNCLSRGGLS